MHATPQCTERLSRRSRERDR
jgi:hypothetical protein